VAYNPETGTTSEGESIDEALANLKEATSLYLEEFPAGQKATDEPIQHFSRAMKFQSS